MAANEPGNPLLMTALLYFSGVMSCFLHRSFQEKEDKYLTIFLKCKNHKEVLCQIICQLSNKVWNYLSVSNLDTKVFQDVQQHE